MKVQRRNVMATPNQQFQCYEENAIIFKAGSALCIEQMGQSESQFILLSPQCHKLLCFVPTFNLRSIITVQKHRDCFELAIYSKESERKSVVLPTGSAFHSESVKVHLLPMETDSSLVFGYLKGDSAFIFAVDIGKMKVNTFGFTAIFAHAVILPNESISVCSNAAGMPSVKKLSAVYGQWECEEKSYRKAFQNHIDKHEWMNEKLILMSTTTLFVFHQNQLIQKIALADQELHQLVKIDQGLVVVCKNNIKVYGQMDGELSLLNTIEANPKQQGRFGCIRWNSHSNELWVQTTQGQIWVWSSEKEGQGMKKMRSFRNCSNEGVMTVSTGKKYCLFGGPNRSVALWDLQKNACLLRNVLAGDKQIYSCAISPDGDSFMVAFEQKLRIYRILLNKFKLAVQFNFKRCHSLCYSHGGQLAVCSYGKGFNTSIAIMNVARRIDIGTIKLQQDFSHLTWSQFDDQLIVATESNTVFSYRTTDCTKLYAMKFQAAISYIRVDYSTSNLLVSAGNCIYLMNHGAIIQKITPSIQHFQFVFPLHKYYFAGSSTGVLYWSKSPKFQNYSSLSLFEEKSFKLQYSNGNLLAYSSLQEIIMVQCQVARQEGTKMIEAEEIVQLQRSEITSLLENVKVLESNFQILQQSTQVRFEEDERRREEALAVQSSKFNQELLFAQRKYLDVLATKMKQEKESEMAFVSLEAGQQKYVSDIENMYERKLQINKEKYMNLEQEHLEQKLKYEDTIMRLQAKYHKEVACIRGIYAEKTEDQIAKLQEVKKANLEIKKRMEMRLIDAQEENQVVLYGLQTAKDNTIEALKIKLIKLQEALDKEQVKNHNQKQEKLQAQAREALKDVELEKRAAKITQALTRVKLLQTQVKKKDEMVHARDIIIEQKMHQTKQLQKAKYVLGFRTTQIRKDLEPKQALIDKLRSQLLKLDQQFKGKQKNHFEMTQKIEKLQSINELLKKSSSEMKLQLKNKERVHQSLCSQMFMVVNTIEPKQWNGHLVKLYQKYVKEDKFKRNVTAKRDQTSEQINRHLIHVQQSLLQVSKGNDKVIKGKEDDLIRKMKENSELVYELNYMRKQQNKRISEIKIKQNHICKLQKQLGHQKKQLQDIKKELTETQRNSTRSQTAKTTVTRKRMEASRDFFSKDHSQFKEQEFEFNKISEQETRNKERVGSAHRTLIWREDKKAKNNSKLFELAKELETAKTMIKRQDRMIEELNHQLLGHVEDLSQ